MNQEQEQKPDFWQVVAQNDLLYCVAGGATREKLLAEFNVCKVRLSLTTNTPYTVSPTVKIVLLSFVHKDTMEPVSVVADPELLSLFAEYQGLIANFCDNTVVHTHKMGIRCKYCVIPPDAFPKFRY